MSLFRSLALLKHRNPGSFICNPDVAERHYLFTSIVRKTHSIPQALESGSVKEENPTPETHGKVKRLAGFFKEALGLSSITEESISDYESGTSDLSRELKQLEKKIRSSNREQEPLKVDAVAAPKKEEDKEKKQTKPAALRLSAVFRNQTKRRVESDRLPEASVTIKKLSPEMNMFLNHLHVEGYFNGASFMNNGRLEPGWYKHSCGRDFIKFATDKFGKDHSEIAKFLMSSELKKVALSGCPSVASKAVAAAKRMRAFFGIPEQTVCRRCALRSSCKSVNQQLGPKNAKKAKKELSLLTVLRLITLYSLKLVPPNLTVPDELKASVDRLLRHTVELSRTTTKVEVET